ncbi:MAG: ABC transporter ATP-binding protein [Dialister invisus]
MNIDFEKGHFVTFLGPSGCGKTTLLRMVAGFYEPDDGEILLNGKRIERIPPYSRNTAMVFQEYALFPHMNVFDNVSYGLRVKNRPKEEIERRVKEALDLMQLKGMEDRFPNQMSGGQQQRVAVARALVMNPEVLLLDEPLSNLMRSCAKASAWNSVIFRRRWGFPRFMSPMTSRKLFPCRT